MLKKIKFRSDKYSQEDNLNYLTELTENTIILCSSTLVKRELVKEIQNTLNEQAEYNDYCCDKEDICNYKVLVNSLLTTVIKIGQQIILFSVEPTCIFKANDINDIWFCNENYLTNKFSLYPITMFKSSEDKWNEGIFEVYRYICDGRYGTFCLER